MNIIRMTIVTLLGISLASCAGLRPAPPEVQLAGLEITEMSLSHANLLATLRLYNPNSIDIDIKGLEFTLFLNDIRIASGQSVNTFTIPAQGDGEATVRLASSFFDLFQFTRSLQGQEQISFRIAGAIRLGGFGLFGRSIPIERQGTLPLSGSLNQLVPGNQPPQPDQQPETQILQQ